MKLGCLCETIFSGGTPNTSNADYWNGEFHWLSSGETRNTYIFNTEKTITQKGIDNSSTRLAKKNDVVIASAGQGKTRGQVSYCMIDTYINQSLISMRADPKLLDPKFLFYNLTSRYNELRTLSDSSSSRGSLTIPILENIDILLPPLKQQKTIATILSNYDDLIENNKKRIKILEEMTQKIYKEWFVDFKYPGHETVTFKDTELGKIPSDWHIGCIKELNNVQGGYAFKSTDLKEFGEYGVIKIKNIQAGTVDISFCQHVDMINTKKYEKFKLSTGDLLVALTGAQVGKVGIMPYSKKIFYLNQRVGKFIPNNDFIKNNQYVLMYVSSDKFTTQVNNIASGAAQPNISTSQIENIPMIVASDPIIALYEDKVDSICKEIQVIKTQNAILQETRNILLPRFMSGEIDVENMEVV